MAECTNAERELIEAALDAMCEFERQRVSIQNAQVLQAQGVAWGGSYPTLPDKLREACIKVAIERITPERKEALRSAWLRERALRKEMALLEGGIPGTVWKDLVDEIYPKDEP